MSVFYDWQKQNYASLALGFFDGVHLAHQELIKKCVECAKKKDGNSALITFLNSPYSIIKNQPQKLLTDLDKKIELIETLNINDVYFLDFLKYKDIEAKDYIENFLIKNFNPKYIVTGFNHNFGANKKGTPEVLGSYSKSFKYVQIPPVKVNNVLVSSTNIKNFIEQGEIKLANKMLNRNFSIKGVVIKGQGLARNLGYKTANIIWNEKIVKPKKGVYFGFATHHGKKYKALINFGTRPTVDKNLAETLEVHLKDFSENLYGETLEVEFSSYLREEKKFNSINELKLQINKDYQTFIKE